MSTNQMFLSPNKARISVFVLHRSDFLKTWIILNVWRCVRT